MRQFRRIHKHLDRDTTISVVNAIVDYCNSLLYSVHDIHVKKRQRVLNSLAHIVTQAPLYTIHPVTKVDIYTSIPEMVRPLRWLPVWSRIHFKINLIIVKAIADQQSPSLWTFSKVRDVPKGLRSAWATCSFCKLSSQTVEFAPSKRTLCLIGPCIPQGPYDPLL